MERGEEGLALFGSDELHADHIGARDANGASADIEENVLPIAFEQKALALAVAPRFGVAVANGDRKAAKAAEVTVIAQLLADTRTADFKDLGVLEQTAVLDGVAQHSAEAGAVIQADVSSIG